MNRFGLWIVLGAAAWLPMACDPKPSKPTDLPKPIAQAVMQASYPSDSLPR